MELVQRRQEAQLLEFTPPLCCLAAHMRSHLLQRSVTICGLYSELHARASLQPTHLHPGQKHQLLSHLLAPPGDTTRAWEITSSRLRMSIRMAFHLSGGRMWSARTV